MIKKQGSRSPSYGVAALSYEVPFIRASTVARDFLISSRILTATGHWDVLNGGFRLCGESTCAYCRDGARAEKRALMRLEDEVQGSYLFEARERVLPVLRVVQEYQLSGRSAWVRVVKEGSARNSPVRLDIQRVVAYSELYDIQALYRKTYGLPLETEPVSLENEPTEEDLLDARRAALMARRERG